MKAIFSIIIFSISFQINGQSLKEIKRLLSSKDFISFSSYIDVASKKYSRVNPNSNVKAGWNQKRDLIPHYQECIIDIDESFPDKDDPQISTVERFRINLITTSTQIIYFDFAKKESTSFRWNDFELNILDSFRNHKLLTNLKTDYHDAYNGNLDFNELFVDSYVYGSQCSIGGERPELRIELDEIVENKNILKLEKWLKSANTEKQVYGVDGLIQLKKKGYKLTTEQTRLIQIIENKQGYVNICKGCVYSDAKIKTIINYILSGQTL